MKAALYVLALFTVVCLLTGNLGYVVGYLEEVASLLWARVWLLYERATQMEVALCVLVLLGAAVSIVRFTVLSATWYRQDRARERMYSDHDWTA